MRIMQVHNYYTEPGGEDTLFHATSALLRSRGQDVFEYIESNKKIETTNQVVVALQTHWSSSTYQKLKKALHQTKPHVVHFHNTFPLISPSAYHACHDLGIPVVQTVHNPRLLCPAASFYRDGKLCIDCLGKTLPWPGVIHACYHDSHLHTAVVASMLTLHRLIGTWRNKIDIFICSTDFYRDLFVKAGFSVNQIAVLPHFSAEVPEPDRSKKLGDYVLFLGRLDPEKGVNTLLQAWLHLKFPLKIRGNGRLDESARRFARQNDLSRIEFIGRVPTHELSNLIGNARFLVMPSEGYYESFGMVIIEAYSRGIPVVASNIGVIPELVSHGVTGMLFEAGNPLDLAEKVKWMWEHPTEVTAMGQNGLKTYNERFTPDHHYTTLLAIYQRLINEELP